MKVKSTLIVYQTNALMLICLDSLLGLGYTVPGFPNGFHSFPGETLSYSAVRHPSVSSLRHSSVGEDSTHALIGPDDQVNLDVLKSTVCKQQIRSLFCCQSCTILSFSYSSKAQGILIPCHPLFLFCFILLL